MEETRNSGFERHLQTIVGALLVGMVGWVGISVTDSREKIGRMDEKFIAMAEDIAELKGRVGDGVQLQLQIKDTTSRVNACHYKIEGITSRVTELEKILRK